jgi:hypothetical protein
MPSPSSLTNSANLRAVRRWTIIVATFYAAAALGLVLVAALHEPSTADHGRAQAAEQQRN